MTRSQMALCTACDEEITTEHWGARLYDRLTRASRGNYHFQRVCVEPVIPFIASAMPGQLWWCDENTSRSPSPIRKGRV